MAGNVIPVETRLEGLRLRHQHRFNERARQEPRYIEKFVLIPIVPLQPVDVQSRDRFLHCFCHTDC